MVDFLAEASFWRRCDSIQAAESLSAQNWEERSMEEVMLSLVSLYVCVSLRWALRGRVVAVIGHEGG